VEARDRALVADRLKSEFLANVSHELRTPLNGILGLTEGLLEAGHPEPDPERRTALETVRRCAEGLRVTVTDLLELSGRPLDGEAPVEVAFEPAELARSVVASFAAQAGEKGVELAVATGPGSHGRCLGDAARLRRALERLVSNAVKYTDRGHCRVEVAVERVGERPWLRLGVVDTGLGIAAEELGRIFQPFALVDGSSTRLRGGVGAGLPLARRTAESLGGRLDVHSELGRGSTFTLCVPVQGAAAAAESVEAPPAALPERRPRGPLRVLVAEDNPINQRVMVARLGRGGHQVTVVDDGEQAVSAATAGGFDLVLMDLQMPRMDGIEAARQIRARLGTAPPIVAVTAHAYQFEWGRCSAAGIDDYLTKPFGQAELEAVLQRVAGGAPAPE
jgi:CheY-like chemotaxis protein